MKKPSIEKHNYVGDPLGNFFRGVICKSIGNICDSAINAYKASPKAMATFAQDIGDSVNSILDTTANLVNRVSISIQSSIDGFLLDQLEKDYENIIEGATFLEEHKEYFTGENSKYGGEIFDEIEAFSNFMERVKAPKIGRDQMYQDGFRTLKSRIEDHVKIVEHKLTEINKGVFKARKVTQYPSVIDAMDSWHKSKVYESEEMLINEARIIAKQVKRTSFVRRNSFIFNSNTDFKINLTSDGFKITLPEGDAHINYISWVEFIEEVNRALYLIELCEPRIAP